MIRVAALMITSGGLFNRVLDFAIIPRIQSDHLSLSVSCNLGLRDSNTHSDSTDTTIPLIIKENGHQVY